MCIRDRLMPYLGDVRLSDIDSMAISSLFVKLRNDREGGRPLSGTTAHDVFVMLNHIMKDATPVSYTHLDVYKRQALRLLHRPLRPRQARRIPRRSAPRGAEPCRRRRNKCRCV